MALAGVCAGVLAAPASASADYCDGEDTSITAATAETSELVQLCLLNVHRATNGLPALTLDPSLRAAARGHSRWMDDNNSLCHYPDPYSSPPVECDGSPDSRATAAGYPHPTGENILWTNFPSYTPREVFELWHNSPGHNTNMLYDDYATAGIGIVTGRHGVVGTQHFGTAPNGGTDTAVSLLRRDACPAAEAAVTAGEAAVANAERKLKGAKNRKQKRKWRKRLKEARADLAADQAVQAAQCHVATYVGSSLSPP